VYIIAWFYQLVNRLPSDCVNNFTLSKVEDPSVAEHPGSASALLDVVVAVAVK
jgi:hypothetical protein